MAKDTSTINLLDYKVLSFDVYGTLIDWEGGIITALQPLLTKDDSKASATREELMNAFHKLEADQQTRTPSKPYNELLATVHQQFAEQMGLPIPTNEESTAFGNTVGEWPAFTDTVDALRRLSKTYKLVVLSNVDRASFAKTNAGPLAGVKFDAILTAQDIGSYKPDLRNFEYMLEYVKEHLGVEKAQVLQTAQSQFHDHQPAQKVGIRSVWIARKGAAMGNREGAIYDRMYGTLGEMADAVEAESKP
ncbi:putative hydrolase [Pseudovirgaria hyperparasitica]|uniref:Putative hydrolase n=1 Tax=Pseudovirgaria hyperparasitica TaxID=470096 RepID=A0A6A6WKU5_9PEZI|nr:putative hydrolase [Pseudovirgaria hyperparasitica]KAF2762796.1 putative hydrolase [Pseudovirgaria hyperparasitica]